MKLRHLLLIASLGLLTSACSSTHLARVGLLQPGVDNQPDILQQASRIRALSPTELGSESDSLQKAYAAHRREENRLRLALFLSIAPPPHADRARALSLFDVPASEASGRGRNHPLAQLLLPLLQDNRRLDDSLAASLQKQRELQQSNDAMRQKLDAIREIEVKMQERPNTK
ncbi:hypothetical protein GCM10027046_25200 [Uliginosibacterium flavum]|uniref:Dihydrolipoamide acyltransferase n=1 Tax=Uliginosibacterium flavum TaxID=1396831 RepID=A0ABV2TKJ8_9RHOO